MYELKENDICMVVGDLPLQSSHIGMNNLNRQLVRVNRLNNGHVEVRYWGVGAEYGKIADTMADNLTPIKHEGELEQAYRQTLSFMEKLAVRRGKKQIPIDSLVEHLAWYQGRGDILTLERARNGC